MSALASVIIPAHNEAAVIARLLSALMSDPTAEPLEIIVVANGCTDNTADIARTVSGPIQVIEIAEASKIAALNAGDAAATYFPRMYIDADVMVSGETVRALGRYLASVEGPFAASAVLHVDASTSSWPARAFYSVWEQSEYRYSGHVGSGIYGVTEEGRARFQKFPDVIADDRFVQLLFAPAERGTLFGHTFSVRAPSTLRGQMRRATRIAIGNHDLYAATGLSDEASTGSGYRKLLGRVLVKPKLWPAFPVYCFGYVVPQLRARQARRRGARTSWNRDESSRQ
jgi:glycosyltransferase involved in cell wall biosynthesis